MPESIGNRVYQIATYTMLLYNTTAQNHQPFDIIFREKTDHGVYCGIIETETEIFIIFRGSVTLEDWARDAISYLPGELNGTEYPLGFVEGMDHCIRNLTYFLKKKKPIYIGGHSLGAAHAAIFYQSIDKTVFPHVQQVVLMGCPNTTETIPLSDINLYNFRNGQDFVMNVPPEPWHQSYPIIQINGGHDCFPNLFMYHHIEYYLKGILDYEKGV